VQDIGVHGKFKKHVVPLLMMSAFLNFPGAPRACAYFRDSTAFPRIICLYTVPYAQTTTINL
jgi:hypothetical protein